jgi:membrane-bound lytic murein transglycosylase B
MRRFPALLAVFLVAACASRTPQPRAETTEVVEPVQHPAHGSFASWVKDFKQEARAKGISAPLLEEAFAGVEPIEKVIRLDRKQPEGTFTFAQYKEKVLPEMRIRKGQQLYAENRALLDRIGAQYGVQPRFIVALWGIETSYGANTGGFGLVPALATLAYDGRRSAFFRKELLDALKIVDAGHIDLAHFKGSWAGAMGQCQFMPSSFHRFAVDGNGDGRKDIWGTKEDVFASIANYLSKSGWNANETWGREVKLPADFNREMANLDTKKTLETWRRWGVRKADGGDLPMTALEASVIFPDKEGGTEAYLIYPNYRVILAWNRSRYFATSVGLLADQIGNI